MKRFQFYALALILGLFLGCQGNEATLESGDPTGIAVDVTKAFPGGGECTTINSGEILASDGSVILPGKDDWGYNYQAHLFEGYYCDAYRDADWCQEYADDKLVMKWNDAWLSNMDCDGDGLLDRHYGFDSYIGSGAWLTNVQSGEYFLGEGEFCTWNYFVKIVAAPADAELVDGMWYSADGVAIGPVIWGEFAIIQQVVNDECEGVHGVQWVSPDHPDIWRP